MTSTYQGGCLCGAVRYEYTGKFGPFVYCHCSQCRKAQGAAFGTNAPIEAARFKLLSGKDALKGYESSPGKKRMFCSNCGSPLFSQRDDMPDVLRLRMGTLETPIDDRPLAHIFVGSKANWYEIHDKLPQFAEFPPQRG
ncbi:MAG: GFA family protein [Nevskiales bacterium]